MQTRRVFLKVLLALGAIVLPWSLLPTRVAEALKTRLGLPPVALLLPPKTKVNKDFKAESLSRIEMDDIFALTGPEMQGRKAGSVGEVKAVEYLSSQLSMLGLKPMGDHQIGFTHVFTIPPVLETRVNGRLTFKAGENKLLRTPSVNLLGALIGENTEEIILLSAHYDHLGTFEEQVYPGANDNASGVGCVLDVLRRILREGKTPKRTIVLAFWGAEEMGFVGSQAFVRSGTFPLHQIQAVLNVDTVGNGMIGDFALWADGDNPAFKAIRQASAEAGASAQKVSQAAHNSDSISFASVGIPAVTLMARDWLYKNHTPEDNIALLKPEQIRLAAEIVYRAVHILAF
ncbi:M20/M25/M40 family metallo-hydrolase [Desulfosporosinus fructosivorans]|uniref:M20/M25/M40 family metallo-hydrolase n=1 Tax=Desulfosporosinus fructosivorans TaxID=2018669 RepID=A0A4Z0RAX4_9FIRM|nr:M20/M25/M40 family metallo-hydrolase [Desulfosporosinus fructosivorans]TGE39960.1 M20/M25/M40 family metallo-hydrolase [Desulfosporosinus fructosivorans]